jgi:hypothetical protein
MSTTYPVKEGRGLFGDREYRRSYALRILILDGIMSFIGLGLVLLVFTWARTPGDYEVTLHVTFGALICTLALFRAIMGYGDFWPEVVLFVLGFFVVMLPHWLSMQWDPRYANGHYVAGGIVMVFSVISALMTIIEMRGQRRVAK